jgi:predicted nuclease of restriction endonuclease-like RecB superfamily
LIRLAISPTAVILACIFWGGVAATGRLRPSAGVAVTGSRNPARQEDFLLVGRSSRDPVERGQPPQRYDSRIEERFARDFSKASLDWDLFRGPEPFESNGTLVFPDFAIIHRRDTSKRFLLEIVGFWTPEYLPEKLRRLRELTGIPLILCINRELNCGAGELPERSQSVWFQKRIEPDEVLAVINKGGVCPCTPSGDANSICLK